MKNQEKTNTMDIAIDEVKTTATRFIAKWVTIGVILLTVIIGGYFGVSYIITQKAEEAKQAVIEKTIATKKVIADTVTIAQTKYTDSKQAIINKYVAISNNAIAKEEAKMAELEAETIIEVHPIEATDEINDNGTTLQEKYEAAQINLTNTKNKYADKIKTFTIPKWGTKDINTSTTSN